MDAGPGGVRWGGPVQGKTGGSVVGAYRRGAGRGEVGWRPGVAVAVPSRTTTARRAGPDARTRRYQPELEPEQTGA